MSEQFSPEKLSLPAALCAKVGRASFHVITTMGSLFHFFLLSLGQTFSTPHLFVKCREQLFSIGSKSLFLIALIGIFCGMVLGLQGYYTLVKFGSTGMLGAAVALTLIRELGPVLTAIMLTGRAGSAMTAEIGVMRISDQIDALEVMDIQPIGYLSTPRLLASLLAFPLLTAIFNVIGILGGYVTGVLMLGINEGAYFYQIQSAVSMPDVVGGFIKAITFGVLVTTVCCHQGYYAHLRTDSVGPAAVGSATTSAVVLASSLILVADYVLTSLLL